MESERAAPTPADPEIGPFGRWGGGGRPSRTPRGAGILQRARQVDPRALVTDAEKEFVVVQPAVRKRILADLDRLSAEQQRRAADLVHGLVSPLPTGASVDDLLKVAGTLDKDSARQMMNAIEEGCERVDCEGDLSIRPGDDEVH